MSAETIRSVDVRRIDGRFYVLHSDGVLLTKAPGGTWQPITDSTWPPSWGSWPN